MSLWSWGGSEPDVPAPKIRLWVLIVLGPVLIALGIRTYFKLADFEESGGVMYLNRYDKLFYDIGGKNAVLAVWCTLGVFYIFLLYRFFKLERENRARIAAAEERIAAAEQRIAAAEQAYQHEPRKPVEPPRPEPPRLHDDPFRDPPAKAPIIPKKAEIALAPAPRASTPASPEESEAPKFLK